MKLSRWETDVVNSLSPENCRAKALDCQSRADTLEDTRQKAAMLQYVEWWNRLAEYRENVVIPRRVQA